ncbi:sulfatase [Bremerella sp.]|uniref:sulfatase family protein n=1 Tax=Bremerella sp. TaxID=2795602 RepID=UPI00391CEDA9
MSKAICIAFAALLSFTAVIPAVAAKPNIVIVLTDDQGPWAFGSAVRSGKFRDVPAAATPNLDRLASEGAVFRNFFCTTPVCSPARASFMTGRYASELGIPDFIPQPGHKLYDSNDEVRLDPDSTTTIAELLKKAGYTTGLVGKWHLGDWTAPGNEKFHPTQHGFDYFMGLTGGGTTPDNPMLEEEGVVRQFEGLTTDILTDRAIGFVERNKDQPFFLCLATRAPHGRWLPVAPEDWEPYAELDPTIPDYPGLDITRVKKMMREYLASTSGVDRNLGRLLDSLDKNELSDNTIVIFTSDHGFNMGHHGIWHKGNGLWATKKQPPGKYHNGVRVISNKYRPNLYDESLRVPAVVRWPGVIAPGTVVSKTATALDVFPTLAQVAQVSADPSLKGRSLVPLLKGETPSEWNDDVFAEYDMIHYATASLRCYRTDRYKLVRDDHNEGCDEFFNLTEDPSENRNLINDPRPEIQQKIKELDALLRQNAPSK